MLALVYIFDICHKCIEFFLQKLDNCIKKLMRYVNGFTIMFIQLEIGGGDDLLVPVISYSGINGISILFITSLR